MEDDPLCTTLDSLCEALDSWRETLENPWQREDRAYRKELAENIQALVRLMLMDAAALEARKMAEKLTMSPMECCEANEEYIAAEREVSRLLACWYGADAVPAAERERFKNRVAEQLREKIEQVLADPKKSA